MAIDIRECAIEWEKDGDHAGVTAYSGSRLKGRIMKLAESHPDECKIMAENPDGSIFAHVPIKWVKVSPPRKVSEEQAKAAGERLRQMREQKTQEEES